MSGLGFSLLAFVKSESSLLQDLVPDTTPYNDMCKEILKDVQCMWGVRWTTDFTLLQVEGKWFLHGNNNRFTVSNNTIRAALGRLAQHVDFVRSSANIGADDLIKYQKCLDKWGVEQNLTSTSGWDEQEQASTSIIGKRKRYS